MMFIWLFMGYSASIYSLDTINKWIIFTIGTISAYTIISKYY
jgi:hypothetical protein